MVVDLALLALLVLAINLLPALGPPTWLVLVVLRHRWQLPAVPVVAVGALAAASGRYLLALAARALRDRLPRARVEGLQAAGEVLVRHRGRAALGLGLFLLAPVPSAQLFEAAGLLEVPLRPLVVAFAAGRLVTYSLYVGSAAAAERSLGSAALQSLTSWPGVALQVALVLLLWLMSRVDWARRLGARPR